MANSILNEADSPLGDAQRYEMLQAGLDLLDQGITVFDADLRLVAWNEPFLRLLGFPGDLAQVGVPFETFIRFNAERGEYGPGEVEAQVAERLAAARAFRAHASERTRPNGRILLIRCEPLPHQGFVTLYTDVTEQRYIENLIEHQNAALEERVRRRTAQLENANANLTRANADKSRMEAALVQAQKMEAIGQLTGGLAHDFNNLLTVIIGNLAVLQDHPLRDEVVNDFVEPALQSARRGVELIKRLLTFSRQQPLEPRPVNVGSLITEMTTLVRRSLPESILVSTDLPDLPYYCLVDPGQLESALLNFALNARDAMPEGGRLHIAARLVDLLENAADFEVAPGSYILIEVTDNGTGMDAETLSRVFEPFFTTKRFGSGSGLGLSMVYGFVRQSGGGIRIQSQPGQGSSVLLVLPRGQAEADPGTPGEEPPPAQGGELVLLVEDEPNVRRVVRQQLIALDYTVIEAENGSQALELVENVPDIAIVVSDVVMPGGMNGRQLAGRVLEAYPGKRVVLMSGYAEGWSGEGADTLPVLAKPFTQQELARSLRPTRKEEDE